MNINMNTIIEGVTLTKACGVKPDNDKDSVSKRINLRVKFDGALVQAVFDKALAGTVIVWQNGPGRKSYDTLVSGQTIDIAFTSPARAPQIDPRDALLAQAKAEGIDINDEKAIAAFVVKEFKKRQ